MKHTKINTKCAQFTAQTLIFLIKVIRPLLGPACCKHPVSCTQFAIHTLHTDPLYKAIWKIFKRIISCNPFTKL